MNIDIKYTLDIMEKLINIKSPSGNAKEAVDFAYEELKKAGVKVSRTNKGAIYGTIEGKNTDEAVLLTAHVDTLGAMVREIKSNGRLKLAPIGGFAWGSIEGENAYIKTDSGKVFTGTLLPNKASVHIFEDVAKEERIPENMEIRIDEDVTTPEETRKLGIEVGDFVAFEPRFQITENGYIKSRHLDDKCCVSILITIAKYFVENNIVPEKTTHFYVADHEEIGHGLYFFPDNLKEVMAVDIGTVGGIQRSSEKAVTIFAKDSVTPYDYEIKKRLVKLAKDNGVEYRVDLAHRYGSDASIALTQGNDVRSSCIGPGVDSTHHYERTHKEGIENTIKLVVAYLLNK